MPMKKKKQLILKAHFTQYTVVLQLFDVVFCLHFKRFKYVRLDLHLITTVFDTFLNQIQNLNRQQRFSFTHLVDASIQSNGTLLFIEGEFTQCFPLLYVLAIHLEDNAIFGA